MNTYYLRCRASQYSTLISRGIRMGAIREIDGVISPVGVGAWDYIGVKVAEPSVETPNPEPVGGSEDPYVHINFRTVHDLAELARSAAIAGDVDIAMGMQEIADYFITDEEGHASAPLSPIRVFL